MEGEPTVGWHPDPSGPRRIRFWDGERWTGSTTDYPTKDEWKAAVNAFDWGDRVLAELRRHFAEGRPTLEPVRLIDASLEADPDGVPVLLAVYEHAFWPERTGMRRRLDRTPVAGSLGERQDLAEWLASDIAWLEMGEPLGRQHDLLVEDDNGVWWWGDSYPDITQHPDYERLTQELHAYLAGLRADDARALHNARTAVGISVEQLAEASGIEVERLREVEATSPEAYLSFDEWVKLAVVFAGYTLAELKAQRARKGDVAWPWVSGHTLQAASQLVDFYFSTDDPDNDVDPAPRLKYPRTGRGLPARHTVSAPPSQTRGVVLSYDASKGTGVIQAPETPGGCSVHSSAILGTGIRELEVGERVLFKYDPYVQESYFYRATQVWRDV